MVFLSGGGKKRSSIELSNNISERRCELKANEPVSEHSERASGYATDLLLGERSEASGKSGVYYILQTPVSRGFFRTNQTISFAEHTFENREKSNIIPAGSCVEVTKLKILSTKHVLQKTKDVTREV